MARKTPPPLGPERPRQVCPICGAAVLIGPLYGHVGSNRCLAEHSFRGKFGDPVHGPRVLRAVRNLENAIQASRKATGGGA